MTRREIREHIFLMLFRKDFHDNNDLLEQMEIYLSQLSEPTLEEAEYLTNRFQAVLSKLDEIDEILSETASGWALSRMGKVELTILRLAVFEMKFDEGIPIKVAINEAVELAKTFGGDDTPGFVNGILAKLA
ncbi:MAG: transcription antitermination factor NusB [Clostridiales bacterium]|nr:transcription antitermination factor NusB [Clostridiales bacterium]